MTNRLRSVFIILMAVIVFNGCKNETAPPPEQEEDDIMSGGEATTFITGSGAFSTPAPNLSEENLEKHLEGDLQFEQSFIKSPAPVNPGLGPLFVSNSCINCHVADGKGQPPQADKPVESLLFRISIPGRDEYGGPNPVPGFGTQLQNKAIVGYNPEGMVNISYMEIKGEYPDGTFYTLRKPVYTITGQVPAGTYVSPRIAPAVFGLGLLEAIPDETILTLADESDLDNDGISGKVNYVWDYKTNSNVVGKFGWKANTPTLLQQTAGAYNEDMGITSPYFPMENCYTSSNCDTLNDDPEIDNEILEAVAFYVQTLAVPARRNYDDPTVKKGKQLFAETGCASCHTPTINTGVHPTIPELSNQKIHPYTDLLLHDMGEGLADNRPDFDADGNEWRTAPLWGIGLLEIVNGHPFFLHDGRALSLEEAILWHDGEAKKSKENFMNLSKADREALLKFLSSL